MKKRTLVIISIVGVVIISIIGCLGYWKYQLKRHPDTQKILEGMTIFARADYKDEKALDKAEKLYKEALEINPNNAAAYGLLGAVYSSQERFKEAEDAHKKAIELNPNSAAAYYGLGVCYRAQERYDEAAKMFNKALELNPKYEYAQIFLKDVEQSKLWKKQGILLSPDQAKKEIEELEAKIKELEKETAK